MLYDRLIHTKFFTHPYRDPQDTNAVQFELVQLLIGGRKSITVVGDDCQTIHEHAGARPERILEFPDHFPGTVTVKLERNYRSTGWILDAANNVIKNNVTRTDKRLVCTKDVGEPITLVRYPTEIEEARGVSRAIVDAVRREGFAYRDVCILYRINALSQPLENALKAQSIPYRIIGGLAFFERAEVRDALAYLVVAVNPSSSQHVLRALASPPRGVGVAAVARLKAFAETDGGGLLDAAKTHMGSFKGKTGSGLQAFMETVEFVPGAPPRHYVDPDHLASGAADILSRSGLSKHLHTKGYGEHAENIVALLGLIRRTAEDRFPGGGTLLDVLQVRVNGWNISRTMDNNRYDACMPVQHLTVVHDETACPRSDDAITLMSVHRSKGLEWPYVHVVGYAENCFPFSMSLAEGKVEGERRLAYVAITRAKRRLALSYPAARTMYFGTVSQSESRFVAEMQPKTRINDRS